MREYKKTRIPYNNTRILEYIHTHIYTYKDTNTQYDNTTYLQTYNKYKQVNILTYKNASIHKHIDTPTIVH